MHNSMIRKMVGLVVLCSCMYLGTAAQLSYFQGSFNAAKKQAGDRGQLLFVYACADWSPSCGELSEGTFTDPRVKAWIADQTVPWYLDMSNREADDLPGKFRVTNLPAYFFFDADGKVLMSGTGYFDADEWLELAQKAKDPAQNYAQLTSKYASGDRDPAFVQTYIEALYASGGNVRKPVLEYLNTLSDADYRKEENFSLMYYGLFDLNSRAYQYVVKHIEFYRETYGAEMTDAVVIGAYQEGFETSLETGDTTLFATVQAVSQAILPPEDADFVKHQESMMFAEATEDWDAYTLAFAHRAKLEPTPQWEEFNQAAWICYLHIDNPKRLEKGLYWVNRSIRINRNYANLDTKASLLYKLNRKEEAKQTAREAIAMAKKMGEDYSATEKLLKQIGK